MVPTAGASFVDLQTRFPGNSSSHRIAEFDFAGSHRTQSCRAEGCARSENIPPDNESVGDWPHTHRPLAMCPTEAAFAWTARYPGNLSSWVTVWAIAPDTNPEINDWRRIPVAAPRVETMAL